MCRGVLSTVTEALPTIRTAQLYQIEQAVLLNSNKIQLFRMNIKGLTFKEPLWSPQQF